MPLLTIIVVLILVGILIPKRPTDNSTIYGTSVKFPYVVFLLTLASSPVVGTLLGSTFHEDGKNLGFLQYLWVGVVTSLPLSLVAAYPSGEGRMMLAGA